MRLTIDTGAILHRIRRAIFRLFDRPIPAHCADCGVKLTDEETHYYGHTCNRCEGMSFYAQGEAADGVDLPDGGRDGR